MSAPMKILVAYDGSDYGDAIFDDLLLAGLPKELDCLVLSVAERWLPPPSEMAAIAYAPPDDAARMWPISENGAARIRGLFPGWSVTPEVAAGSPARNILHRAQEWGAQLIVVGSLGRSAWERLWIGSVSHKLASVAPCSVRVARPSPAKPAAPGLEPVRILLAYDGLPGSQRALQVVAGRVWPAGTQVVLHTSVGFAESPASQAMLGLEYERARELHAPAETQLRAVGLSVVAAIRENDPKVAIVEDAKQCQASSVFLGCNDESALTRFLLGTVSEAVVTRAPCSVEVVR